MREMGELPGRTIMVDQVVRWVAGGALLAGTLGAGSAWAVWPFSTESVPVVTAQSRAAPTPVQAPDEALRTSIAFMDVAKKLQGDCSNAAWSLWYTNDYAKWRNRETRSFSMHQSTSLLRGLPPAPAGLSTGLSAQMLETMGQASELMQDSVSVFHDMANYINAKDYEDDKFKKGDELNARLLEIGRTCHAVAAELRSQYRAAAQEVIEAGIAGGSYPAILKTMLDDWRSMQRLSDLMGQYLGADLKAVAALGGEVTKTAETRRNEIKLGVAAERSPVTSFYRQMEERVAVKTRKMAREMSQQEKEHKDEAADRPRSDFNQMRETIDMQMPGDILRGMRNGLS